MRRPVDDGSTTLDVNDVSDASISLMKHSATEMTATSQQRQSLNEEFSRVTSLDDTFSHKTPAELSEAREDSWLEDGTYNGRAHCNIFVDGGRDLVATDARPKRDGQFKELKGRLTNTVEAEAVLLKGAGDAEEFEEDLGKQVAQQTYITLLIGDWVGALECILAMMNLVPEEIGSALEYKDDDGNTLMHRAVMQKDSLDISTEPEQEASRSRKAGLKFVDNSDQVHREKIVERLFMLDQSLLLQQNRKGDTPLECCESDMMREHIRMLVRKKHLEKQFCGSSVGKFESIQGMDVVGRI